MKRLNLILIALACFYGAIGVSFAAMAAHRGDGANLQTASTMLIMHGAALVGLGTLSLHFGRGAKLLTICMSILALGVALFAGDLAMRTFVGTRLFPNAAPIGGTAMIIGWATCGLSVLLNVFKRG